MSNILFLSTDGLTDQLGQSQILPYLLGLNKKGHAIAIISFEKPSRNAEVDLLRHHLRTQGICWYPLSYHNKPPVFSTVLDLASMYRLSRRIVKKNNIQIIHCRSYLTALIGMRLKVRLRTKFLFDTRGFWIDERMEGKIWNPANPIYATIIRWLRNQEKRLYKQADAVVMLTEASRRYLRNHAALNPVTHLLHVIPCCTDADLFSPEKIVDANRVNMINQLGIDQDDMIVLYHGSLGTWYKSDELVDFFVVLHEKFPAARLLVVTHDATASLRMKWNTTGFPASKLITVGALRSEIPTILSLAHLAVFFIKPSFSKMASSPTKLGELCLMRIPFITNSGVGDGDELIIQSSNGMIVHEFSQQAYQAIVNKINSRFLSGEPEKVLEKYFSLESGVEKYHSLYLTLTGREGYI